MTTKRRRPALDIRGGLNKTEKKQVGKMIDRKTNLFIETKEIGIRQVSTVVTAAGIVSSLTNIEDGTGNGQRVGLEIRPTILNFYFEWIGDAADDSNSCRLTLIQWFLNDNNDPPTLANVFDDVTNERPFSDFKFSNKGKHKQFRVLFDRIYTVSFTKGPVNKASQVRLFGRKLPNVIAYNNSINDKGKNKVYMILWSDSAVSGPLFKMHGKFAYKDA